VNDFFALENLLPLVKEQVFDIAKSGPLLTAEQRSLYEESCEDLVMLTTIIIRSKDPEEVAKAKQDLAHVKSSLYAIKAIRKAKLADVVIESVGKVMGALIKAGIKSALPL
jgi:hypothetical protein